MKRVLILPKARTLFGKLKGRLSFVGGNASKRIAERNENLFIVFIVLDAITNGHLIVRTKR